jgi:hypothetical protein
MVRPRSNENVLSLVVQVTKDNLRAWALGCDSGPFLWHLEISQTVFRS